MMKGKDLAGATKIHCQCGKEVWEKRFLPVDGEIIIDRYVSRALTAVEQKAGKRLGIRMDAWILHRCSHWQDSKIERI